MSPTRQLSTKRAWYHKSACRAVNGRNWRSSFDSLRGVITRNVRQVTSGLAQFCMHCCFAFLILNCRPSTPRYGPPRRAYAIIGPAHLSGSFCFAFLCFWEAIPCEIMSGRRTARRSSVLHFPCSFGHRLCPNPVIWQREAGPPYDRKIRAREHLFDYSILGAYLARRLREGRPARAFDWLHPRRPQGLDKRPLLRLSHGIGSVRGKPCQEV